jgi:hypothetical protein
VHSTSLAVDKPTAGQLVFLRSRTWLVEEVLDPAVPGETARVRLACADDDNQGRQLEVLWDHEPDRQILSDGDAFSTDFTQFDSPQRFAAYLHALRWNCVTATDAKLFQSPFRAGIRIDAYQMEPLRKALQMPRVNLFIADDTGLGKTIEAALILRELLLRKKVRTIVVAAPPSVLEQWQAELEDRFGLTFVILDRTYMARMRRERGFGVNPWRTHSRFLVSHALLADPTYSDPLREWLGTFQPGSILVLDEAHNAAPAAAGRFGIESKFTRAIRDVARRFEHRLFLSATPHNGHSSSFATLLELLDPVRFTRGVPIVAEKDGSKTGTSPLEAVMVRRLKEDIRRISGGFPERQVVQVRIDGLPENSPELVLSRLLEEYRTLRDERLMTADRRVQVAAGLLTVGLQQRLLSSIEAFYRSLIVHRRTVERHWAALDAAAAPLRDLASVGEGWTNAPDADDERSSWSAEEADQAEIAEVEALSAADAQVPAATQRAREQALLDQMQKVAEQARGLPDAKLRYLINWIRANMCPQMPASSGASAATSAQWNERRVIIFTENREGTRRYLFQQLSQAIAGTDLAQRRIEVIDGLTAGERRQEIQRRFNAPPSEEPLRILLATDAAREGLNLQAFCSDLFHYDLPWNPSRIEQRNGRIDRKLQPAPVVRCHYFILPQREEDRVLEVLVQKVEIIRGELGSLPKVLTESTERIFKAGIRKDHIPAIIDALDRTTDDSGARTVTKLEIDPVRKRADALKKQIAECEELLATSEEWLGFDEPAFRATLSSALELLGGEPLRPVRRKDGSEQWVIPQPSGDRTGSRRWQTLFDALREPRKPGQQWQEWRSESPVRPLVFADSGTLSNKTVHLHLEHRVAQRLLARFRAQGFVEGLSRICAFQSDDPLRRVVLIGRLSLYGARAERLHEKLIQVTARWLDPSIRRGPLEVFGSDGETTTIDTLTDVLAQSRHRVPNEIVQRNLLAAAADDITALLPVLQARADAEQADAQKKLTQRGDEEAQHLAEAIERHRRRVAEELARTDPETEQVARQLKLALDDDARSVERLREEQRELTANRRLWQRRIEELDREVTTEPQRVRDFYTVKASRFELVGLVYLWPASS